MSITLVRYVLKAAVRDRVMLSFLVVLVLAVSLSFFMGSASVAEKELFTLVFLAGSLRLACMAGIVLFIVFFMRRAFETKDIEFLLSRPVSRINFILSHALAFSILAFIVALAVSGIVAGFTSGELTVGHLLWSLTVTLEYVIMANVALFFSMVVSSAPACALFTFAFYVLGRMIGQILGIANVNQEGYIFDILGGVMEVISIIVPRFDLMAQSTWIVYGESPDITFYGPFMLLQGAVFTALTLSAAMFDFTRRQF